GAEVVTGGGRIGDQGYFVEPTVITNTRPEMKIVREEIFGPVVVAERFKDLDQIAAAANDSEYGLGAGIWTRDISKPGYTARAPLGIFGLATVPRGDGTVMARVKRRE